MKQTTAELAGRSGTALFVRRPILAFVLSALIVIAGLASLFGVEVRELPDVDRPVISVTTDFPGARPKPSIRKSPAGSRAPWAESPGCGRSRPTRASGAAG